MAKIHWLVYIIVGAFVSVFSWREDFQKLMIFFYAGLVFVAIGVMKLVFSSRKNRAQAKTHHQARNQQKGRYCHNCGSAAQLHHIFCTKCGAKL